MIPLRRPESYKDRAMDFDGGPRAGFADRGARAIFERAALLQWRVMRLWECSLMSCVLAGLACAGSSAVDRSSVEKAALTVTDEPLPGETADPAGAGEA